MKRNYLIMAVLILCLMSFAYLAGSNKLNWWKSWYETCDSEEMVKNYPVIFKQMMTSKHGDKIVFKYVNVTSKPQEINNNPRLVCKTELSYSVSLGLDYANGTIDLITTIKDYDKKTNLVNFDSIVSNERVKYGNILEDSMRKVMGQQ